MGLKDLFFEQENASNQEAAPATIPILVDSDPNVQEDPISKSSPVGKLMDLMVALESTLPDKDLRYKVAMTTLQAQGITAEDISNSIDASLARLSDDRNNAVKIYETKMTEIDELINEKEHHLNQAEQLSSQIETSTLVLNKDIENKLKNLS